MQGGNSAQTLNINPYGGNLTIGYSSGTAGTNALTVKRAIFASGNIIAGGGFSSGATNSITTSFTTGGYTNSGTNTLRLFILSGVGIQFSNVTSGINFTLTNATGNILTNATMMLLNPNESVSGTNCTVAGMVYQ